ncbi:MAG TPA: O-antigen ligase family protein [Pyrinomonadaceae bacterium]|nr:O-antigen ligase family protein [Pyrinomonadaceae bacterium]
MTTSVSNDEVSVAVSPGAQPLAATVSQDRGVYRIRHTLASRFAFLVICVAIVTSALAYGTVHYWALGLFNLGGLTLLVLWVLDAWRLGNFRVSRNLLQLPLLGALVLGLVQLLPLRDVTADAALVTGVSNTLSFDPYSTRLVLVQLATLLIYFSATLVFIDTPHRLHVMVRTIMIFGFCLAIFGLTQSFTSPTKVYWIRELNQSTAFGPFINRHHFAGYMELTIALPLGLLFAGSVDKEKRLLYGFVAALMGVALVMTASRGGIISLVAEVIFFAIVTAIFRKHTEERHRRTSRLKSVAVRAGLAVALLVTLFFGVLALGGEMSINRLIVDSVNTNDPTTGRAHFWSVTLQIIKAHPLLGTGLGAFGVIYTRFDTRNGLFRLEQAHNDYLQVLSDGGIIGAALALAFVALLFYKGFVRARSGDDFRRGVALASLGGCFAVLVHSFFDFTLHTTSNALLFLVLAALATINGRVEDAPRRRRRRKSSNSSS